MRNMNWRNEILKVSALAAPLIISVGIGGATLGWSSAAQARQPAPKAGSTSSDEEVAKQVLALIREANTAYDAEDYTTAAAKYSEAYALYPDPAILVRMGKTAEKMGKTDEAIGHYKEFVRLLPDDPTSAELQREITKLEKSATVQVTVASEPAGAQVFVGDEIAPLETLTPATVELTPGKYSLRIEKDGFESYTEAVKVVAGQEQQVSVTLTRQMLSDVSAANFETEPVEESDGLRLDIYGWTTLGLGVATLATSGVFYALASTAEDDVNTYNKRAPDASREDLQDLKDSATNNYKVGNITAIAGGVLTAVGAGLVTYHYLSADEADAGPTIVWGLDAAGDSKSAWLGINGSF